MRKRAAYNRRIQAGDDDLNGGSASLEACRLTSQQAAGFQSQLRRAALSIPTNLVEGYARKGDKELARFVNISVGSLAEVEYLLSFANRLGYLKEDSYRKIEKLRSDVGSLSWSLYKKVSQ